MHTRFQHAQPDQQPDHERRRGQGEDQVDADQRLDERERPPAGIVAHLAADDRVAGDVGAPRLVDGDAATAVAAAAPEDVQEANLVISLLDLDDMHFFVTKLPASLDPAALETRAR